MPRGTTDQNGHTKTRRRVYHGSAESIRLNNQKGGYPHVWLGQSHTSPKVHIEKWIPGFSDLKLWLVHAQDGGEKTTLTQHSTSR